MAMVKAPFNGQLNPNEIFSSIYNMIISQQIMDPNISDNYSELVSKFKTDGSLCGDTKLFYDVDVLVSRKWLGDSEAANLLNINRPEDPYCQAITLDQFRQIDITVDNYLSKRAWSTEGVFSTFNSVILGLIGRTKKLFENTLFNTYLGTTEGAAAKSELLIDLDSITETGEEKNRLEAQTIAQSIADLVIEMKDYSRDFNDLGYMRAYEEGQLVFIWNSKWINKITKIDLPTIFHKEGLMEKMDSHILPARYFGRVLSSADAEEGGVIAGNKVQEGAKVRSLVEKDYTIGGLTTHVFPGDLIAVNTTVGGSSASFKYAEVYAEDEDIICKVVTNDTYKFMSGFEVGTNFFNSRALTENHYLTWSFGNPDRLKGQPLVTVKAD